MLRHNSFPSVHIPSASDCLPIEVILLTQLGPGAGDQQFARMSQRQMAHPSYIDALSEPSTKLADVDFTKGEHSSLYTFAVDQGGHPFHRHAGHRVFTAISGSGGAQLRFSTADDQQITQNPESFFQHMRVVNVPPDCLFTLRFGGGTWHQFVPLVQNKKHPALFAISCHTDELGGVHDAVIRDLIVSGKASIPILTETLPETLLTLMRQKPIEAREISSATLTFEAPAPSWRRRFCDRSRSFVGSMMQKLPDLIPDDAFLHRNLALPLLKSRSELSAGSMLRTCSAVSKYDHQDVVAISLPRSNARSTNANAWMAELLNAFLHKPSLGISILMRIRNALVWPFLLRRSSLGCPVSSLQNAQSSQRFQSRFPVLEQRIEFNRCQVLLGADDRHLRFRTEVDVQQEIDGSITFRLATRVQCKNLFGRIYIKLINKTHQTYVAPTLLRQALMHAIEQQASIFDFGALRI